MQDISKIFQNSTGHLDDAQIQFLLENFGEEGVEAFMNGGSMPEFATGGPFEEEMVDYAPIQEYGDTGKEAIAALNRQQFYGNRDPQSTPVGYDPKAQYDEEMTPLTMRQADGSIGRYQAPSTQQSSAPEIKSNDYSQLGDFNQAFKAARSEMGATGEFIYNGKRYTTKYKNEVGQSRTPSSGNTQQKQTGKAVTPPRGTTANPSTPANAGPKENVLVGTTNQRSVAPNAAPKGTPQRPADGSRDHILKNKGSNYTLDGRKTFSLGAGKNRTNYAFKTNEELTEGFRNDPMNKQAEGFNNQLRQGFKSVASAVGKGKIWYRGQRYDLKPKASVRKWLNENFEDGGEMPMYENGNTVQAPLEPMVRVRDSQGQEYVISKIQASTQPDLEIIEEINPHQQTDNQRVGVENWQNKQAQDEMNKEFDAQEQRMGMLNTLTGNTDYSVEDALYKVGQAATYNPSKDVFTNEDGEYNKGLHQTAQGFNALKGIAAGGKAILGGVRNVMEGAAYQKRNDLIMNEYQRKQQKALKNQGMQNREFGGDIPFENDGSYLQYFEDGGDPEYAMGNRQYLLDQMPEDHQYSNSEEMGPSSPEQREATIGGIDYYIYGSGPNARMVPKSAVDGNAQSVYNDEQWREEDYSSEHQQQIKDQAAVRNEAQPVNIKSLPPEEIKRIQQVLIDSGYDLGKGGADGLVGNKTNTALEKMRSEDYATYKYWVNVDSDPAKAPAQRAKAPAKKAPAKAPAREKSRTAPRREGPVVIPSMKKYEKVDADIFKIKFGDKKQRPMTEAEKRAFKGFGGGGSFGGGGASGRQVGKRAENGWADGGEIPFYNDGGYLKYFEEGNGQQYSEMGMQDPRDQMDIAREMTGEYFQQQPDQAGIDPNAELEKGEYVKHPDGQVQQVEGRSHKQGGERLNLEGGTQVISDKLKLGARNAKLINAEHDLNVKAGDTYAKALEKFTKKVGLKDLNEQQEEYFNKLKKDTKTKSEETSELNSQFLSEKIHGIEQKKALLEELRVGFTDKVYALQQSSKSPRGNQEGNPETDEENPISEQQIMEAMQMAEYGGEIQSFANGGEFVKRLSSAMEKMGIDVTNEENAKMFKDMVHRNNTVGYGASELYSILKSHSPLRDLPKDYKEFQSSRYKGQAFDNEDVFGLMDKDYKKGADVKEAKADEKAAKEPMTKAKLDKMTPEQYVKYLEGLANLPTATYKDIAAQKERWSKLAKLNGVDTAGYDLDSQEGQDKLAGALQDQFRGKYSKTTDHYSTNVAPTQTGLQSALDNKLITEKELNDFGVKTNKGQVLMGSMDGVSKGNSTKITARIKENGDTNPEGFKAYVGKNFNDGKAYYRFPELNKVSFTDETSRDEFLKKGEYEEIEDVNGEKVYYSKKEGQYFSPEINAEKPNETTTPADPTAGVNEFNPAGRKSYTRPTLPDMSLEPPRPMEMHRKAQHRFGTIDPIKMSADDQLTDIYRQTDAANEQMTGLTDTQRAAGIMNLTANTQDAANKAISGVNEANTKAQAAADLYNVGVFDREEMARNQDADKYEEMQFKASSATNQDYDDYMDKNREIRIKRFNYLTKDKQMHDTIENFKTDSFGNIVQDKGASMLIQLGYTPAQITSMTPEEQQKAIQTKMKVNSKGEAETTTTTSTNPAKKINITKRP